MHCLRCGRQNKPANEYCEGCGATLGIECSACHHLNGPTARFCGRCSAALKHATSQPAADPSWQHMLASLNAKGGERKRLTILFADIRNSTSLIDSLGDPELGMKRLQPVLDIMKEAVARYEGVVNKSQGDGVMAIFGAPHPHEDHAVRGCLAALAFDLASDLVGAEEFEGVSVDVVEAGDGSSEEGLLGWVVEADAAVAPLLVGGVDVF